MFVRPARLCALDSAPPRFATADSGAAVPSGVPVAADPDSRPVMDDSVAVTPRPIAMAAAVMPPVSVAKAGLPPVKAPTTGISGCTAATADCAVCSTGVSVAMTVGRPSALLMSEPI